MRSDEDFIAPELVDYQGIYMPHKVDIWAIGVVCYYLLTAKPPFESEGLDELHYQIVHEEPSFEGLQ